RSGWASLLGGIVGGATLGRAFSSHRHGGGVLECLPRSLAEQRVGDRPLPRGQETGGSGGRAAKKNYRAYKRSLPRTKRQRLRSLMHDFRRRPEDLEP